MSVISTKLVVNKADAYGKRIVTLTSGMSGAEIEFEFSDEWTGLGKTAVFKAGSVTKYIVLTSTNKCHIPAECLENSGINLIVGVYGTDGDDIVIPTIYCSLGLIQSGTEVTGTQPGEITQSLYNQVSALLTATQTELANVKETTVKSIDATIGTGIGTPTVSVTYDWVDSSDHSKGKKGTFAFNNLKGNGIASVQFSANGNLTITQDNGTVSTFNGISTALSTVTSTITSMSTVQSTWASSESARQSAEALRVSSESLRVSSETARASAELTRSASESARIVAESTRASNEVVRSNNETSRVASMSAWTSEQSVWTSEETVRSQAEVSRNSNEVIRNSNELVREENKIVAANATVDANTGTPSVVVTMTPHTGGGKDLSFAFHNLKGESGGGGGGTSDFDSLTNRPKYNGATMTHSTDIPEVKTATWDAKADVSAIPTKTSDLTNDSGFLTAHQSLDAYRTASAQDVIDENQSSQIVSLANKLPSKSASASDVGKFAKVKTVADGIVSEWEFGEGGSGGVETWELINSSVLSQESASILWTNDSNGNPFSLKKIRLLASWVEPETVNDIQCRIQITDNSDTPLWGHGAQVGAAKHGAGVTAGTVIYVNIIAENVLHDCNDAFWVSSNARSANDTSMNGNIYTMSADSFASYTPGGNNSKKSLTQQIDGYPITANKVWFGSYGTVFGVGTEIRLYGVRA